MQQILSQQNNTKTQITFCKAKTLHMQNNVTTIVTSITTANEKMLGFLWLYHSLVANTVNSF